jgi:hypothetical protein
MKKVKGRKPQWVALPGEVTQEIICQFNEEIQEVVREQKQKEAQSWIDASKVFISLARKSPTALALGVTHSGELSDIEFDIRTFGVN